MNDARIAAMHATIDEHVRAENNQDLDAVMNTFGDNNDISLSYNRIAIKGQDKIRRGYFKRVGQLPGFSFDVINKYVSGDTIIAEQALKFKDRDGNSVEVPAVVIYDFDKGGKLSSESVYLNELPLAKYFYPDGQT